ncbi:MAG: VWA domain-containing protein [Firmicutes bacterium]|nr:VWA domain-containing protein [Bacillota bacterium]
MSIFHVVQEFLVELRCEGIPITPSQAEDCFQALLLLEWLEENQFYACLSSTLIKEYSHQAIFRALYARCFHPGGKEKPTRELWTAPVYRDMGPMEDGSEYAGYALPIHGMQSVRGGLSQSTRNPLEQSFSLANLDEVRKMEAIFPVIAKRLAARMIKKNVRHDYSHINFRSTIRQSMATGGVPLDIITSKKHKEKPSIIALCDISGSVMTFSSFALALLASMHRFFQQLRTFAFIEDIQEVTDLMRGNDPLTLRTSILTNTREVAGTRGYTDYGATFKGFVERYENLLTHKTSVLIFGDARNNWLNDQAWALQEIKARAKKVYWFNPEPQARWSHGDTRMHIYLQYCSQSYSCPNLAALERSFTRL